MPLTRRQTALNTRSSGPSSISTRPGRSTGAKRRQTKAKSKTSSIPKSSALRSDPNNQGKFHRIVWNLLEKHVPSINIILEPYKNVYVTAVFIIAVVTLLFYAFWIFRVPIINAYNALWDKNVTADLPSVYFNDGSYHFTTCPDEEDMDRHQEMLKDQNGKNLIFIKGTESGWTKSDYANYLGVCLFDSLKQSKQDNRPVDVITVNVSSESLWVIRNIFHAIKAVCGSEKARCIKEMNEELSLVRYLYIDESNSSEMKLEFLFTKLDELLTERNSHAVVILYSWRDSDTTALFRFRQPRTERFTTDLGINLPEK